MNHSHAVGSNISLVKAHNLRAILLSLLEEGRISRIQLAKKTGLSTTTITNLISEMLADGLVVEEDTVPTGRRGVGRPQTALQLVPTARYAAGVHIGIGLVRVAITDLFAGILHSEMLSFDRYAPPAQVLESTARLVQKMVAESGIDPQLLIGLGVGASGLVDYTTGQVVFASNLDWRDVPVKEWLESWTGLPVVVDNNVRAMALGEAFFGAGRGASSLALVYGKYGVGAGIVFGGQIYRGSGAGAGEIGHLILIPEGGLPCSCGQRGCLETLVSEPVFVAETQALAHRKPMGMVAQLLAGNPGAEVLDCLFQAARQGDIAAQALIEHRASYLGVALANLVNLLNPELIILSGIFAQGEDLFLPPVVATLRKTAFAGLGEKVCVRTSPFGRQVVVVGAAALALMRFFYQEI